MAGKLFINSFHSSHIVMEVVRGGSRAVSKSFSTKDEARAALTLAETIAAAQAADDAYSAAVTLAGFKSRWDVPRALKASSPQLRAAYHAKVDADLAVHDAFIASRKSA